MQPFLGNTVSQHISWYSGSYHLSISLSLFPTLSSYEWSSCDADAPTGTGLPIIRRLLHCFQLEFSVMFSIYYKDKIH